LQNPKNTTIKKCVKFFEGLLLIWSYGQNNFREYNKNAAGSRRALSAAYRLELGITLD